MTQFNELGLAAPLLRALEEEGYTSPTPIQAQAIPAAIAGRDVLGIAQTGTGKTAAFALPLLHRLANDPKRAAPYTCRVLILSPTRELASQIHESVRAYGRHIRPSTALIFGGVPENPQKRAMAKGVDVLIATPGRLMDLLNQRALKLEGIEVFVLDEADQMLDRGFWPSIRRIAGMLPRTKHTMFFSATMPEDIAKLAKELLPDPVRVEVTPVATTAERVNQRVIHTSADGKRRLLADLLRGEGVGRALVFSRTKHGADRIVKQLEQDGLAAGAIHGNKSQGQRERALEAFKKGTAPILVATDIAARGIDVDGVTHVIQYDLPEVPETYVHRIGRTARAGASGEAVALVAPDEISLLRAVEKLTRQQVPAEGEIPTGPVPRRPNRQQQGRPPRRDGNGGAPREGQRHSQGRPGGNAGGVNRAAGQPPRRDGGGQRRPEPARGDAPRKDRSWREGDFRDSGR
ncbi:DEAD/DEAH box helicase [Pararoseomonas indoligenes]|uniref:DEAD/DEAH box helicase n=1 Tax=Roseomonas indoligenes TaxID=2820811 RepID=A0A940S4E3_9PROT|nr:DEAD/DEAH box helicase [Pararoseomonas indoligenes]MBP0491905.1 DEAD/DEAH box helicase [Pararoseomonas indoligenes]